MINIKFLEFKKIVLEDANTLFSKEGFRFNKGAQSFKKSIFNNCIEYSFDFINYYPNWYEYNFGFRIWIKEISEIEKELVEFAKINEGVRWATSFFEGDFIQEVKHCDLKYRSGYYSEIHSLDDISKSMGKTLNIIEREALPLSYSLCSLKAFQDYYLTNKSEIVRNFGSEPLFVSALLAAYLKSTTEYYDLSHFLKNELDIEKSKGSDYKQLYFLLGKIDQFINHKVGSDIT